MSSKGKKTRNPGFVSGGHWVTCSRCDSVIRNSDARKEWTGLIVCADTCWEPRHPQDFVRAKKDDMSAKGLIRPDTCLMSAGCSTYIAVAGYAIAGCAITGEGIDSFIPSGTFNTSTL